ncbi:MAG: hypothetical protein LBB44_00430 [Endomicrobium sp.]|jgi:hypothetical protein|nr:hypothetical protein [Endomicrobium sp.]
MRISHQSLKKSIITKTESLLYKDKGGLYYALGLGYEFSFGITYGIYKTSIKASSLGEETQAWPARLKMI